MTKKLYIYILQRGMKVQDKAVMILTIAILISAVLGIGSTHMSGHEVLIFRFLEFFFLMMFGSSLVAISVRSYKRGDKITSKTVFISALIAVVIGGLIYTCIDYYL